MSTQETDFEGFEAIAARFPNLKLSGDRKSARAWCPCHQSDGKSRRENRTLSMREKPDGSVQITCFAACAHADILAAVGLRYIELLPDNLRYSGAKAPHVKPSFAGWPCIQVAEAIQIDAHVIRIFGGMILDSQHLIEGLMPFDRSEWNQLRGAHHRLGESLQKIEKGVRYG